MCDITHLCGYNAHVKMFGVRGKRDEERKRERKKE